CQPTNEDYFHEQNSCYNSNSFGSDHCQPSKYTVNHPIFNAHNEFLNSQNELSIAQNTIMEQMTQLTSMCEMVCQIVQKKQEEKRIEEEQAASARYWKIPACCDDDDDYDYAITPEETDNSLSMGDEHLDTIPATESDKAIKSSVEDLVPIPSESEEISSGSTTILSDISLPDYEAFSFDDDHIEEISGGSTTTHSDISLSEYDSFIFDFTHEEFVDELARIISPPEYDCFYFWNLPDPGELMSILNFEIRENLSTTSVNLPIKDDHSPLLAYKFDFEGWSISITFRFSLGLQTPDDLSRSRLGFIEKMGVHG
nr:hypothetical protein [Tanacetum cinerariifolium]